MTQSDVGAVADLTKARDDLFAEIGKVIIGQRDIVEQLLLGLLSGGHCLLIGVPGLAKTLLIRTLAETLDLSFGRIQFTPDLMPSDITGTEVLEEDPDTSRKNFRFVEGPIFANVILADEINRTPPKTQAALLEAMQEHAVTAGTQTRRLSEPFFVLATQNPIEQEGTYPLPEAQLDRFIFELRIDYPEPAEEEEIVRTTTSGDPAAASTVLDGKQIVELQELVRRVPVADQLVEYAVRLVRSSRPGDSIAPDYVRDMVNWGGWSQGLPVSRAGRQGPRHSPGPPQRRRRRHSRRRPASHAPSHRHQLSRRSREHHRLGARGTATAGCGSAALVGLDD